MQQPSRKTEMIDVDELSELSSRQEKSWNRGLSHVQSSLEYSTVISRFEFVDLLNRILVSDAAERIIWRIESNNQSYFFPCYVEKRSGKFLSWLELRHISDLYPGRSGPSVLVGGTNESLALVDQVFGEQGRWHSFSLCVLGDGPMERHLLATAKNSGFEFFLDSSLEYPYIELPTTWDEFYGGLAKKFRYNIRNSQKLLAEVGELSLERITDEKDVRRFLDHAYLVERRSWKESAGTSLTTNKRQAEFHSRLAPIAASNGIFRGYILYLDGSPIAHVYGLLSDNVFYSLKLSYSEQFRKYSPGIVVTARAIQDLILTGVEYWDFSGPTEEYKRRWTNDAYCLKTYTFFSHNTRGRLLKVRRKIRDFLSSK